MSNIRASLEGDGWARSRDVSAWGRAFFRGSLHDAAGLANLLREPDDHSRVEPLVRELNGFFAVVVHAPDKALAAVDRRRSKPLYFGEVDDVFHLSDDPHEIDANEGLTAADRASEAEYLQATSVLGTETLSPDVAQVPSGGVLKVSGEDGEFHHSIDRHYRYNPYESDGSRRATDNRQSGRTEWLDAYDEVLDEVFERLISFADGRQIVLSLSAGYDSRLIATKLAAIDAPNVTTFTYERRGEHQLAEDVASALGFDWEYVTVSPDELRQWYHSPSREEFDRYAGYAASVPVFWLSPVVERLKSKPFIDDDAVIVTGDTAHTMAEHVPESFAEVDAVTRERFVDAIHAVNYTELDVGRAVAYEELGDRIVEVLDGAPFESAGSIAAERAIGYFEEWDWQERQSKRIRSNYVYEYFDLDWWFPLWDHQYMDFWSSLPIEVRLDKWLVRAYVDEFFPKVSGGETVDTRAGPYWLRTARNALERVPILLELAKYGWRRVNKPSVEYDFKFGMMSESTFDWFLDDVAATERARRSFTPEQVHAMYLLGYLEFDRLDGDISIRTQRSNEASRG